MFISLKIDIVGDFKMDDTLNIIQNAEIGIKVGTDLWEHKYSFEELKAILKKAKEHMGGEFDLNSVESNQLIEELRNRGFVVSGRLAGVKY